MAGHRGPVRQLAAEDWTGEALIGRRLGVMSVSLTYYLDIISSWCHWAEPAWAELKQRFAGRPVEFTWKIALLDSSGLPTSQAQEEWFYRRSGTIVGSPYMLNAGWVEPAL